MNDHQAISVATMTCLALLLASDHDGASYDYELARACATDFNHMACLAHPTLSER
jgi:hypothetical protein